MESVVRVDYTEADVRYDLITGTGDDPYDGLDRFDRVIDCLWFDYGSSADAVNIAYGYDRVDNRTYREDTTDSTDTQDQLYAYDAIYRLKDFERGELSGNKDGMTTLDFAQEWSLDATDTLAAYTYLGMGAVVQVDYPEPDVRYDLITGTGDDPYDGLDRFDRVIDCLWYDYGATADATRLKYGYDRVDNRTYRQDAVDTTDTQDQLYAYDGIYRLTDFDRGELNTNKDGLDSLAFAQEWSLDATGNWSAFKQDDDGDTTWDLEQTRTSNVVNEITDVDESTGASWATPAYDPAGNMTTVPQPADPTATFTATYDSWNRLVKIVDTSSSDTIAEYAYDGIKRRTLAKNYVSGSLDHTRHYYYSDDWQILEERIDSSTDPDRQFLWGQRYTDDLILRDRDTDANASLDERLYCLQDDNWNVVAVSDSTGDVQERYSYDAYGIVAFLTPAFASRASSDFDWEILFAGYRSDHYTWLLAVRNRYYHPNLGCWVTRDPQGTGSDDLSLYRYVSNNPSAFTDAEGLDILSALFPTASRVTQLPSVVETVAKVGAARAIGRAAAFIDMQRYEARRDFLEAWTESTRESGRARYQELTQQACALRKMYSALGLGDVILNEHISVGAEVRHVGGKGFDTALLAGEYYNRGHVYGGGSGNAVGTGDEALLLLGFGFTTRVATGAARTCGTACTLGAAGTQVAGRAAVQGLAKTLSALSQVRAGLGKASSTAARGLGTLLTRGYSIKNQNTGAILVRALKMRHGVQGPSYEILKIRKLLRIEAHPISRSWPRWAHWPHWHLDVLPNVAGRHLPIVEPMAAAGAAAYWTYRALTSSSENTGNDQ